MIQQMLSMIPTNPCNNKRFFSGAAGALMAYNPSIPILGPAQSIVPGLGPTVHFAVAGVGVHAYCAYVLKIPGIEGGNPMLEPVMAGIYGMTGAGLLKCAMAGSLKPLTNDLVLGAATALGSAGMMGLATSVVKY